MLNKKNHTINLIDAKKTLDKVQNGYSFFFFWKILKIGYS